MRITNTNEESSTPKYVMGLLKTTARKVCTNISETLGIMHDVLNREVEKAAQNAAEITSSLQNVALESLSNCERYLIIDDTPVNKQYANDIEGLEIVYDSSEKRSALGLRSVIGMITDTRVRIPIDAEIMISKVFGETNYKTKSEIAYIIIERVLGSIRFNWLIADAHYATEYLLPKLFNRSIKFLMKIPRNRVVTINNKTGQLQKILRLKKNNRFACGYGTIFGLSCYFYVLKIDKEKIMYLISSHQLGKEKLISTYKIRWQIECFNRTAKQLLGFSECQMRSFNMQRAHLLFVLWAYALADIRRVKDNFDNTEQAVRSFRVAKPPTPSSLFYAFEENSYALA